MPTTKESTQKPVKMKECIFCETLFETRQGDNRWCSKICQHKHYERRLNNILPIYKQAILDAQLNEKPCALPYDHIKSRQANAENPEPNDL